MTLGTVITQLTDESAVQETLAGLDDLVLLARLRHAADTVGEPLGHYASSVVGQFLLHADDEQWLSLITTASQAENPAAACLRRMLGAALESGRGPASR